MALLPVVSLNMGRSSSVCLTIYIEKHLPRLVLARFSNHDIEGGIAVEADYSSD